MVNSDWVEVAIPPLPEDEEKEMERHGVSDAPGGGLELAKTANLWVLIVSVVLVAIGAVLAVAAALLPRAPRRPEAEWVALRLTDLKRQELLLVGTYRLPRAQLDGDAFVQTLELPVSASADSRLVVGDIGGAPGGMRWTGAPGEPGVAPDAAGVFTLSGTDGRQSLTLRFVSRTRTL
jgi:hypothetical protein